MEAIKVVKLNPKAFVPTRGHKYDAGLDLYCLEDTSFKPGEIIKVPTGIAIEIPPGFVGLVRDRSSVSLTGLKVTAGVIDAGYTGECNVALLNITAGHGCVRKGQKIAQLLVIPVMVPEVVVVDNFESTTGRQSKGWGSTGGSINIE